MGGDGRTCHEAHCGALSTASSGDEPFGGDDRETVVLLLRRSTLRRRSTVQWEIPYQTTNLAGGDSFFPSALFDVDPMVLYVFGDVNASGATLNFDVTC